MPRHRSSAAPLAWGYAGLVVYASLYPFSEWRLPGTGLLAFLSLPWPRWWTAFDLVSNLLGYLPFGALLFGAQVRTGRRAGWAAVTSVLGGTLLSFSMEFLQNFLPQRVPSNVDLGLNAAGTALGVALGALVHVLGGVDRWQSVRDRWFIGSSAGGLALLLLWPVGLLFPMPLPLGLGQVLGRLQELLLTLLQGTYAEAWAIENLGGASDAGYLSPLGELSVVVLGLLAPCLVGLTIAQRGWRRLVLVLGASVLGFSATTLSTALNFGPQHALAWATPMALTALLIGSALAAMLAVLPRRAAAGLGLVALSALVVLVAQAPADPYFAESLQAWEQGRFIRFHGAAQWVGWLWPYAAMVYLLVRIGARGEGESPPTPTDS